MKRIITCSDGTWNKPGNTEKGKRIYTNVELLYNCIAAEDNGIKQLKIYDAGVGTNEQKDDDKLIGGLTGEGIDKNIKDVYSFICLNYELGDEIYLFGFSRGAYTARSLVGFINNCGILKPEFLHLIDYAYTLYRERNEYAHPQSDLMKSFRSKYTTCKPGDLPIEIHFIGVWDTVGALGLPASWHDEDNRKKYSFHDVKISSNVLHAYHALAIDERRNLFTPTLWELTERVKNDKDHPQKMEQRWFCGVHSDVGGGYAENELSDIALTWMKDMASNAGLKLDRSKLDTIKFYKYNPSYKGTMHSTLSLAYRAFSIIMFKGTNPMREICIERKNKDGEIMMTNEVVDQSVFERYNDKALNYRRSNLEDYMRRRNG